MESDFIFYAQLHELVADVIHVDVQLGIGIEVLYESCYQHGPVNLKKNGPGETRAAFSKRV